MAVNSVSGTVGDIAAISVAKKANDVRKENAEAVNRAIDAAAPPPAAQDEGAPAPEKRPPPPGSTYSVVV